MTRKQQIGGAVAIGLIAVLMVIFATAAIINRYKEGQFAQRQAELQRQLNEQKIAAGVQEGLANHAAEEGRQKDAEIKQLKEDNAILAQQAEEKRIVYVRAKQPVAVRPFNGNTTDADIRAAAARAGLVVR